MQYISLVVSILLLLTFSCKAQVEPPATQNKPSMKPPIATPAPAPNSIDVVVLVVEINNNESAKLQVSEVKAYGSSVLEPLSVGQQVVANLQNLTQDQIDLLSTKKTATVILTEGFDGYSISQIYSE